MFHCCALIQNKKNVLLLNSCYNAKPSTQITSIIVLFKQVKLRLDGEKNVTAMAKFQSVTRTFNHLTLMNNFQKFCLIMLLPYFPSE